MGRHRDLPGRRSSGGESWWERFGTAVLAVVMFVLALPELILWAVPYGLAVLVLTPCALLEMLAQVLSGSVLWLLRSAGLARWRVEVIGRDQFEIHSLTVLLVRGRSTANGLVKALAAERAGALRPFAFDERCRPDDFPLLSDAKVEIVSHRSAG